LTRIQLWRACGIPGFLLCKIDEETGCYLSDEANTVLVQTDWDYPSIARDFGWDITESQQPDTKVPHKCMHSGTDGTVICPDCGLVPSVFISDAADYLYSRIGQIAEDPGYFDEVQS